MSASSVIPIRTEQDYTSALACIETFMDRERLPAEDDEFYILQSYLKHISNGVGETRAGRREIPSGNSAGGQANAKIL